MEATLDCERIWNEYSISIINSIPNTLTTSRFIRINPKIDDIPELDEKDKLEHLHMRVENFIATKESGLVKCIARKLLASCFYFDLLSTSEPTRDEGVLIKGQYNSASVPISTLF